MACHAPSCVSYTCRKNGMPDKRRSKYEAKGDKSVNYFENIDWKGIKKDVQKGMEKGMAAMKKGAIVAQKKAGELTDEGQRQYKILRLKAKMHTGMSDLGARVYELMSARAKNPALDVRVKNMVEEIHTLKVQIMNIEKKRTVAARKKAA